MSTSTVSLICKARRRPETQHLEECESKNRVVIYKAQAINNSSKSTIVYQNKHTVKGNTLQNVQMF